MSRCIFHVDVNNAYLSWEAAWRIQHGDTCDLRNEMAVVGGNEATRHGIVLAKSMSAKSCGIKTGENLWEARLKAPNLRVIPPNYSLYMKCSRAMMQILKEYSPQIQQFSVDESFLDYTGMERLFGPPLAAAEAISRRIKAELGFTVNIGIGENKLSAKMASEFEKPDRIHTLWPDEVKTKLWPLPIGELFMVGKKTEKKLRGHGIYTIGQLARCEIQYVHSWLGKNGLLLQQYANGCDSTQVACQREVRGVGNSTTLAFNVDSLREAKLVLLALSETISMRLRMQRTKAALAAVHVRTIHFSSLQKQHVFETATNDTDELYRRAVLLLNEIWQPSHDLPLRHIGLQTGRLSSDQYHQYSFFEPAAERHEQKNETIDALRARFGMKSIQRGAFLHSRIEPMIGGTGELVMEEGTYPTMTSII